jgi:four helix bundle protein
MQENRNKRIKRIGELKYQVRRTRKFVVKEDKSTSDHQAIAGFEKLWVWQKAFKLLNDIHKFCKTLPVQEKYRIRDQLERSSSSVCDNIAEGYTAYYYQDKIKGFLTARKEAGETQNHIRKLSVKSYLDQEKADAWIISYEEIIRGINGYVNYIRRKKDAKR